MVQALLIKGIDMPRYIAKHSAGHYLPGEEIKGLDAKRIQALLVSGVIEEYQEPIEQKDESSNAQLIEVTAKNAELNAMVLQITTERDALLIENAELKAKVESFVAPVSDALNQVQFEPLTLAENNEGTLQESAPFETQPEVQQDIVTAQAQSNVVAPKPKGRPPKALTETVAKTE